MIYSFDKKKTEIYTKQMCYIVKVIWRNRDISGRDVGVLWNTSTSQHHLTNLVRRLHHSNSFIYIYIYIRMDYTNIAMSSKTMEQNMLRNGKIIRIFLLLFAIWQKHDYLDRSCDLGRVYPFQRCFRIKVIPQSIFRYIWENWVILPRIQG